MRPTKKEQQRVLYRSLRKCIFDIRAETVSGNNNDNRSRHFCGGYHWQGLDLRLLHLVVMTTQCVHGGVPLEFPLNREENRGTERLRDLLSFLHLVSGRNGI